MSIKSRLDQLERLREGEGGSFIGILHRLEGETVEECVDRYGADTPHYVFPPPEPRDENGELAASWIAGCVLWTGERIEPVGPNFDPRDCLPHLYDPNPDLP